MEGKPTHQHETSQEQTLTGPQNVASMGNTERAGGEPAGSRGANTSASDASDVPMGAPSQGAWPDATLAGLQELAALTSSILPDETVQHLKNAGRESLLAIYSLWKSVNKTGAIGVIGASSGQPGEKVRKHIEVE